MQIRHAALKSLIAGVVLVAGQAFAAEATANHPLHHVAGPTIPVSLNIAFDSANSLDAQEVCVRDVRIPGIDSEHQTVTTWQVNSGSWNGQNLAGLTLVLVQSNVDTRRSKQVNCYVSVEATPAQRAALLDAFLASKPQALSLTDLALLRLEPAMITLDAVSEGVILHLGLLG